MIKEKFIVRIAVSWNDDWPQYFENFWTACSKVAHDNDWYPITVANYELRSLGGRLIQTKTQGWYLRWNEERNHTMFVLKWS